MKNKESYLAGRNNIGKDLSPVPLSVPKIKLYLQQINSKNPAI
jgi:hypothetical protein